MVANVSGREPRIRADLPGQEPIPQGLARDDADVRLASFIEQLIDPLLAEQAEGNLEDLRRARFEAEDGFRRFVDGNPVVVDFVFGLQRLEDLVRRGVAHQLGRRIVELVNVDMVRPETLQRPLESERDVSVVEVHPDTSVIEVAANLRGQMHIVPTADERFADDFLAVAPAVDVGGVDEIHSEVDGTLQRCDRRPVLRGSIRIPVGVPADRPRAEPNFRHLQAGATEDPCLHPACERNRF